MSAAEDTKKFALDWATGKRTKSQHIKYYISNQKGGSFFLNRISEGSVLLAMRDKQNNLFVFLPFRNFEALNFSKSELRNPFLALILDGKLPDFNGVECKEDDAYLLENMGSWETLDSKAFFINNLNFNVFLLSIKDKKYLLSPPWRDQNGDGITIKELATFSYLKEVKDFKRINPFLHFSQLKSNINTIQQYSDFLLTYSPGKIVGGKWCLSATPYTDNIHQIIKDYSKVISSRPTPEAFCLSPSVINYREAALRYFPQSPQNLDTYTSALLSPPIITGYYERHFQCLTDAEMSTIFKNSNFDDQTTENLLAYFKADNKWLAEHGSKVRPFALGEKISENLLGNASLRILVDEPGPYDNKALYIAGKNISIYYNGRFSTKGGELIKVLPMGFNLFMEELNE